MIRYTLEDLYFEFSDTPFETFKEGVKTHINSALAFGLSSEDSDEVVNFICSAIYGYFYNDLIAYAGSEAESIAIKFERRLGYDISVKLAYWYKKYNQIKQLLTSDDLSLLQSSKMTSSSNDTTKSAGGTLQKTATTPTGVTTTTTPDEINIGIGSGTCDGDNSVETNGFADKYTNAQQKFANASRVEGVRSGEILREGSIEDLLKVLEKLPASFADEINKAVQKHFIFDYDGERKGYYNETY